MANINDYLLWRGDIPIVKNYEFNEVDDLILARFSYLIFDQIEMRKIESIETVSKKMKDFDNKLFRYNGDKELITYLGTSRRFKNMKVTDFIEHSDKSVEKQFGAITIHISDTEMYVSFIGTDSSIIGWKEDFNLAFMTNIPAQIDGKNYLEKIALKYPNKKIRIGGHSKGGNVAIYSAISTDKSIQDRIISVTNYDGPGFNSHIINEYKNTKILNRITTFLPQDSIIGRILDHEEKCEVVQSVEKGIYQHDIFSWQVLGTNFVKLPNLTDASEIVYKATKEWLNNTTPEQRKVFFDGVFGLFYSTSANTFTELSSIVKQNVPLLFKTYKEISEDERKIITKMLKEFGRAYALTIKNNQVKKIEDKYKKNKEAISN